MKKILIYFFIALNISSCQFTAPEFRKIEDLKVNMVSSNKIIINAKARFHNPNKTNIVKISAIELNAKANDKIIGNLSNQNLQKPIYKDKEILLPFELEVNPMSLFSNLNNIFEMIGGKSIALDLNGFVETKFFMFKKRTKIYHQESINLRK